ncbi:MAG: hypothetical protein ACW967_06590 [Candidatus Hodarchaeales archaeon]|jgi:flavin-dependent dehydrogenase
MKISNFDRIDIIGGNVSGLVAGIELTKKGIPFTIYEKAVWDKPCGGAFGKNFYNYLKNNGVSIKVNTVKKSIFASKYVKMEEIPYKFYITKRKHLQEELIKKIKKSSIKFEKINKTNVNQLSKVILVATGISGLSKYLLNKDFPYLGRYQYYLLKGKDYPEWDPTLTLFYWIPEIKGYAWVFPTINGFVDIGIGGFINTNQKLYYKQFLYWLKQHYNLKDPGSILKKSLVSWGIPMWSNEFSKKVIHYENKNKQLRIGIGDAVDLPQIVSAGGIENAINSSRFLINETNLINPNLLDIDLKEYIKALYNKIPLKSHKIPIRLTEKIVYSNLLLHPSLLVGKITNRVIKKFSDNLIDLLAN